MFNRSETSCRHLVYRLPVRNTSGRIATTRVFDLPRLRQDSNSTAARDTLPDDHAQSWAAFTILNGGFITKVTSALNGGDLRALPSRRPGKSLSTSSGRPDCFRAPLAMAFNTRRRLATRKN